MRRPCIVINKIILLPNKKYMEIPPLDVRSLLRQFNLKPEKGLGQHFLVKPAALKKVVQAAEIDETDIVLEVGPGLGSLTRYLAQIAQHALWRSNWTPGLLNP